MYQPEIADEHVQKLYRLAKMLNMPMTRLVNQLLEHGMARLEQGVENVSEPVSGAYEEKRPQRNDHPQAGIKPKSPKARSRLTKDQRQRARWIRALAIAKILFEEEGYHTRYLEEIKQRIVHAEALEGLVGQCVAVLENLLASPDLNLDELEQATRDAIEIARETLQAVKTALNKSP